jgi:hypothetical protein
MVVSGACYHQFLACHQFLAVKNAQVTQDNIQIDPLAFRVAIVHS